MIRADIEDFTVNLCKRTKIGGSHIFDIDEVPRLFSVHIDNRWFTPQQFIDKDGNDATLPLRILTYTIDIGMAEDGVIYTIEIRVYTNIGFRCIFGKSVEG
jgi:hypothetical protein